MPDKTLKEQFVEMLLDTLDETFENVHGIFLDRGTSLFETLATISAEEASRPVSATCASLAAQVEHVRFYLDRTIEFAQGRDPGDADWGEIWRTVREVTPEAWEASKTRLRETYGRVVDLAKNYDNWEREDAMADAVAMIVHTAYHLGEIRQALCTLKP
ncbi:MAG: hypothetical protein ABI947_16800 [Chloroflexota bacterium]